jgi:hypothetical protein
VAHYLKLCSLAVDTPIYPEEDEKSSLLFSSPSTATNINLPIKNPVYSFSSLSPRLESLFWRQVKAPPPYLPRSVHEPLVPHRSSLCVFSNHNDEIRNANKEKRKGFNLAQGLGIKFTSSRGCCYIPFRQCTPSCSPQAYQVQELIMFSSSRM